MVYILLADGFEEMEALALCDVLRRGGVETALCAVNGMEVTGGHDIRVRADLPLEAVELSKAEMLAVPGGMGGVNNILANDAAMVLLKKAHEENVLLAAICAGPMVLAKIGVTDGAKITAYPGMDDKMGSAKVLNKKVQSGKGFLTGQAPGAAYDFALAALETLRDRKTAASVAKDMHYDW